MNGNTNFLYNLNLHLSFLNYPLLMFLNTFTSYIFLSLSAFTWLYPLTLSCVSQEHYGNVDPGPATPGWGIAPNAGTLRSALPNRGATLPGPVDWEPALVCSISEVLVPGMAWIVHARQKRVRIFRFFNTCLINCYISREEFAFNLLFNQFPLLTMSLVSSFLGTKTYVSLKIRYWWLNLNVGLWRSRHTKNYFTCNL